MTDPRDRRRRAIAEILRSEALASQEEVTARLRERGFDVTQATVSRDLERIGAVKVRRGGAPGYALPDQIGDSDWAGTRLAQILADWVQSVEAAGTLIVMRTPPGSAHLVGLALDQARIEEVAGTICGDDTVFVALRDGVVPGAMAQRFRRLADG